MGEAYWAAREGDVLLHTSLLADIVGAAVELICDAAIIAATSIAITSMLLSAGVTAGSSLLLLAPTLAFFLSGALEKQVSKLADYVSSLFTPSEDGEIISGSSNTHINGKPAARAAGTVDQSIPLPPEQPQTFFDVVSNMFAQLPHVVGDFPNILIETAKQMVRLLSLPRIQELNPEMTTEFPAKSIRAQKVTKSI